MNDAIIAIAISVQASLILHNAADAFLGVVSPPSIEAVGYAPAEVRAGEEVVVRWSVLKRTQCPGTNRRVWRGENGFREVTELGETRLPTTDEPVTYAVQTRIPPAPVGKLQLTVEGEYRCHGKRPVPFVLGPVFMEVVE